MKHLLLPSFELKVETQAPELKGLRLSETQRIKEAKVFISVELLHARVQEEGLTEEEIEKSKAVVVDGGFVFVLTDSSLEEKVDNTPMFLARVTPQDFISY